MTIPIETHLQNFSFLQMDTENHLSPQSSRRLLLAQWKAQRKQVQTPKPAHGPPQRVVVHSEKKHLMASGAARVAVAPRTSHVLESPALRVKAGEDLNLKESTTPLLGRPRTMPKTAAKTEKKIERKVGPERLVVAATVEAPEKKVLRFDLDPQPAPVARKPPVPVFSAPAPAVAVPQVVRLAPVVVPAAAESESMTSRLTSALAAAYRATAAGNLNFARRIYTGILNDTERFENVERSSAFWVSYAMFEEHCGSFTAALQLYERGLEVASDPSELQANMYLFILRMDERIARATASDDACSEASVLALQEFALYVKSNQPAVLERLEDDKMANGAPAKQDNLDSLMRAVAAPDAGRVQEADRAATVLEATTPRRSARLAEKERQNYSCMLPWWLLQDDEWVK